MTIRVRAVDRPDLQPYSMPDRFKRDVTYFMTPPGDHGVPPLPKDEYWVRLDDARRWLEDLTIEIISPLDSTSKAHVELTDEQESWLEWMTANQIEHIRVESEQE